MAISKTRSDIVIAGYDMVTPLGTELDRQWDAFASSMSGVDWIQRYEVPDGDPVLVAGQVPMVDFSKYSFWSERDAANWFSPVIFHSMLVAQRALLDAGLEINDANANRIGITFSSAIGGLDAMIKAEETQRQGRTPHPFTNPNGCLNLVGGKVSILTGATGPIFSPVAACATGAASVASAAMLIKTGAADVVIAGACDFPVIRSLLASFASMNGAFKSFRPRDRAYERPDRVSRPFSADRKGFVVSEGAAALVVTTRGYAQQMGLKIRGTILGLGMTSDAKHYVAPNMPTIVTCIQESIKNAGLTPGDIQAINAHAASTNVGDAIEVKALEEVFGAGHNLPITANKSQIGHTMGASSAIELIVTLESIARNQLLPTLNFEPDSKLPVINTAPDRSRNLDHDVVLSNSFGFGGCNVCLIASGK